MGKNLDDIVILPTPRVIPASTGKRITPGTDARTRFSRCRRPQTRTSTIGDRAAS